MKMFDNITKALFKEKEDGTTIYYAKGLLRKGYIITDEAHKEKIYQFHKRVFAYLIPIGIIYAMLLGLGGAPLIGFIPILLIAVIVNFRQKSLIKDLPPYQDKLPIKEAKQSIANAFPKIFIIIMMINGIMGIVLGLAMPLLLNQKVEEVGTLMAIILLMGFGLLGAGWYLHKTRRDD